MTIYTISGLGANEKVFDKLVLPAGFEFVHLEWILPYSNEALESYVIRMIKDIHFPAEFILMGLSFGGIIAQEIAEIHRPSKLFLFNTIKSESEKPFWISMNRYLNIHKVLPLFLINRSRMINIIDKILRVIHPDRVSLSKVYTYRNNLYTRWAFDKIVNWNGVDSSEINLFHIHSKNDLVFPICKIKNPIIINGGHVSVYENSEEANRVLNEIFFK